MSFKEFGEIIISDEIQDIGKELLENTIGALTADPIDKLFDKAGKET